MILENMLLSYIYVYYMYIFMEIACNCSWYTWWCPCSWDFVALKWLHISWFLSQRSNSSGTTFLMFHSTYWNLFIQKLVLESQYRGHIFGCWEACKMVSNHIGAHPNPMRSPLLRGLAKWLQPWEQIPMRFLLDRSILESVFFLLLFDLRFPSPQTGLKSTT